RGRHRRPLRPARRGGPRCRPAHVPAVVDRDPPDRRPDLITSQSMDNPVYYVQMAHARVAGIARVAAERGVERVPRVHAHLSLLTHERELEVLRSLSELPDVVLMACNERAPHKVTTWVRELAGRFHGFYHDCYVLGEGVSAELTQARLWLVEAARVGLTIGLQLLGAGAPESM